MPDSKPFGKIYFIFFFVTFKPHKVSDLRLGLKPRAKIQATLASQQWSDIGRRIPFLSVAKMAY